MIVSLRGDDGRLLGATAAIEYPTLRDQAPTTPISSHHLRRGGLPRPPWRRVLDRRLCQADASHRSLGGPAVVRGDLSREAVQQARAADSPAVGQFATFDGRGPSVPSETFDLVVLLEAIEHVLHVDDVLDEVTRVTRSVAPSSWTTANHDSLHLRLTRTLGYPDRLTNYQHISEPHGPRARAPACSARGSPLVAREGCILSPYWAVPGMPEAIARAQPTRTRSGRGPQRAGGWRPTYAYTVLIVAEKVNRGAYATPAPARVRGPGG